jgi:hypothetical protein
MLAVNGRGSAAIEPSIQYAQPGDRLSLDTHATLALAANVHPKVVSERLGHASISITLDTYSHAVPAMQEEAAEKVAAAVFG